MNKQESLGHYCTKPLIITHAMSGRKMVQNLEEEEAFHKRRHPEDRTVVLFATCNCLNLSDIAFPIDAEP